MDGFRPGSRAADRRIIRTMRIPLLLCASLLLAACASLPAPAPAPDPASPPTAVASVPERYVSVETPGDELDSLATWTTEDGQVWVIATAKTTHQLVVFDADSGERLRSVGGKGSGPGEFLRPNGVAVHGDLLFVSERDNRRVQVLELPGFRSLATFGDTQLRSPYGLWVHETAPGELRVYVTDSFMDGPRHDQVPPFAQLDQRVRRYRLRLDRSGAPSVQYAGAFGDTRDATALRMVESIMGDPASGRLLIADEDTRHLATVREYTFAGQPTGRSVAPGTFLAEPEGIALWTCDPDTGYWLVADQLAPLTIFRVFDRATLAPLGAFSGQVTRSTDGIALHAASTARFPAGVLYAVHADRAVAAFDLRDVVEALHLDPACGQ